MIDNETFIKTWQAAKSAREAADKLGMKYQSTCGRAGHLRRRGVKLQKFRQGYAKPGSVNWDNFRMVCEDSLTMQEVADKIGITKEGVNARQMMLKKKTGKRFKLGLEVLRKMRVMFAKSVAVAMVMSYEKLAVFNPTAMAHMIGISRERARQVINQGVELGMFASVKVKHSPRMKIANHVKGHGKEYNLYELTPKATKLIEGA